MHEIRVTCGGRDTTRFSASPKSLRHGSTKVRCHKPASPSKVWPIVCPR